MNNPLLEMLWVTKLIVTTLVISPSGALSPGPLSFATIAEGARGGGWRAGVLVSLGHALFEAPYTLLLTVIATRLVLSPSVKVAMAVFSAATMVFFAYLIVRDALRGVEPGVGRSAASGRPLVLGLLFTALNPYFLLWWVGAGWPIIIVASAAMPLSFILMYILHVWYDFLWLSLLAGIGMKGSELLGGAKYRALLLILAALLLLFAFDMLAKALLAISILPA